MNVGPGAIQGNAQVYRTGQGYDTFGSVAWVPNGQAAQIVDLAVGGTCTFAINGAAGMISNGCPSIVQVMWDNNPAVAAVKVTPGGGSKLIKSTRARLTAAVGGSAQQAMQTLNAQWYNALTSALNLSPAAFQLVQGNSVVGTLSENLWSIFDAVPPLCVNNYYNPAQMNSFSSDYGSIINNLNQPGSNTFQNDMGDYYSAWSAFLTTQTTLPTGGLPALFQTWSQLHMPAGLAMQCYTDLNAIYQGAVYSAISAWLTAGGSSAVKAYTTTVEQLTTKIAQAPSGNVSMNSQTETSDVSHTWASGEAAGFFDLFAGEASGTYDSLSQTAISAGMNVSASFTHVLNLAAAPLSQPSTDPILSGYKPWFVGAALELAYQNNNNTLWKNNPPTWANMFGPGGALLNTCSALIIVDGITISVTSSASFSVSDQAQFQAQSTHGFWPFYEASASGGWSNSFSFSDQGNLSYTASSPVGNPVILGVLVTPIAAATML